jgi:diacylglycerol kinase family enzyme
MRTALLANPESGSGEAEAVEQALRARASALARFGLDERDAVAAWRPERIVVAGGDGSIGAAAETAAELGVPIAVIPVGTANDFARALGIPRNREAAVEVALGSSRVRSLDLGFAEHRGSGNGDRRPFVNAASAGLSPAAARRASALKRPLGALAYAVGAAGAGLRARPVAARVAVEDEEIFSGAAWQVTVACTGAFGGGAEVAADPRDGVLDAVVIEARSRARLLAHAYRLRNGTVEQGTDVHKLAGRIIEVEADGDGFNIDGELIAGRRLRFTVRPHAFEVVAG